MISAEFTDAIDPPWTLLEPVRLGRVPSRGPAPDRYVLVEGDGHKLRCDIYISEPESFAFEDVRVWAELLVVGYGIRAYCVDLRTRATNIHTFDSYFGYIYAGADYCLVASGHELLRLNRDGSIVWKSEWLALDGVVVNSVNGDVISGDGEWDPPDGWEPFEVSLATGRILKGPKVTHYPLDQPPPWAAIDKPSPFVRLVRRIRRVLGV